MCYLCKPTPNAAKARKAIDAASKVWKRKKPKNARGELITVPTAWGDSHDWTKEPTRVEPWTAEDFDKHQARPDTFSHGHTRANTVGKLSSIEELEAYEDAMAGKWNKLELAGKRYGLYKVAA